MKCLVSGATGFIGRQLCQQLISGGHSVVALSRCGGQLADGTPSVALDLTTGELAAELLRNVDVVFHLAGIAHQQAAAAAYQQLNYQSTVQLARLAAAAGVKCFLFVSSVKAMGPASGDAARSERDCTPPQDPYGLSKWRAECDLRQEFANGDMSVVILRPALVYGPGARGNLELLSRAVRLGLPRPPELGSRSMVALQDLVQLMCRIAKQPPPGVHIWIACGDSGYSTRTIVDLMRQASGKSPGRAWLPLWCWRLAAVLKDLAGNTGGESSFDKLFGTELYDNGAVVAATGWRPRDSLQETVRAMMAGTGSDQ